MVAGSGLSKGSVPPRRRPGVVASAGMKWLKRIGIGILVVLVVAFGSGVWLVRRSFPTIDGSVTVRGLSGPVTVTRDTDGVPHIQAATAHDLFMAQGYVHAQDRFWQMDFWRHIGSGRLSELFGDSQVDTDIFLRTLGFTETAATEYADSDPDTKLALDAYAQGVNAYLSTHTGSRLALEYAVLGLQNSGYTPEPWTPVDTLTWAKVMAWDLRSNLDEIGRAHV